MLSNNFNFGGLNNNGLPYPADSLMRNPMPINVNSPPFVPQVECTDEFRQYLPVISGTIIEIIQNTAQSNNLRAFTFNQVSENNYANQSFAMLVSTVVNLMMYAVYGQRNASDFGTLLHQAANKGIELFIAANVAQYNALTQYLDQNGIQLIQSLLQELQQLGNAINQMKQGMQQSSVARPTVSFGGGNNGNIGNGGLFQSNNTVGGVNTLAQPDGSGLGSRYSNRYSRQLNQEKPVEIETTPNRVPVNTPTQVETGPVKWVRSDEQPHPPVYRKSTHKTVVQLNEDGKPFITIVPKTPQEMFEYETHTALTSMGVMPSTRSKPSSDEISMANTDIERAILNGEEILTENQSQMLDSRLVIQTGTGVESSLESAILSHEVNRNILLQSTDTSRIEVFQTSGFVLQNLGFLDETSRDEIRRLQDSKTFEELLIKLKGSAASLPRRAWNTVEGKVTAVVNDILRLQLSLDIQIDSFVIDFEDLIGVLSSISPVVKESFFKYQEKTIKSAIQFVGSQSELKEILKESILTDSVNDKEYVVDFDFLIDETVITSLDISSDELDVELDSKLGSMIVSSQSKVLSLLADKLSEAKIRRKIFTKDYVLLNDGVVLRLTSGLINEEFYTASVVKVF